MKKIILVLAVCLLGFTATFAQNKAIGLRGGYGFEITYQQPIGDANRLEADLGLGAFNGLNIAAIYQWVWSLESIGLPEGFKWYAGPGADLYLGLGNNSAFPGLSAGVGGQIGIEYSFSEIPLQLSIDYRPMWMFGNFGYYNGYAGAIRYIF
ncbi:MAG: hypothetical protein WCS66_05575 [Bacteroidales bacterium]